MKHLTQKSRWGFRRLYVQPFLLSKIFPSLSTSYSSNTPSGSHCVDTLGQHTSAWLWALPVTTSQQRFCTSIPLQLGWETGNEEDLFSSGRAHKGDVFQPAFFGVAVSRERHEHQNPVQVTSLLLWRCRSPCSDLVQLHLN